MGAIYFYRKQDPYFCFTNFYLSSFKDRNGKVWKTSEHYYQAQKFINTEPKYAEEIRLASSPWKTKKMGNNSEHKLDSKWEEIKVDKMEEAMYYKFGTTEKLKKMLLKTKDKRLMLCSTNPFWGGELNIVGYLLMKVRERLKKEEQCNIIFED